ncbi:MAG TPA: phosphoribosylformylglycinamidine synthase subunit PurS [Candidatus Binatia bacterium]|nr:phosphoribosylformylglycinamidine synthase subunit PurS [Candidatus Binatia bacterium]
MTDDRTTTTEPVPPPERPTTEERPPRARFRFAVNVLPKPGILDPQGRAVEQSLPHLDLRGISDVRVGRRIEATVEAADETSARAVVERLASELLANPLIERYGIELLEATSAIRSDELVPASPAAPGATGEEARE